MKTTYFFILLVATFTCSCAMRRQISTSSITAPATSEVTPKYKSTITITSIDTVAIGSSFVITTTLSSGTRYYETIEDIEALKRQPPSQRSGTSYDENHRIVINTPVPIEHFYEPNDGLKHTGDERMRMFRKKGETLIYEVLHRYPKAGNGAEVIVTLHFNDSNGEIITVEVSSSFAISPQEFLELRQRVMEEVTFNIKDVPLNITFDASGFIAYF